MKKIGIIGTRKRDTASVYNLIEKKFFEIYENGDWIVSGGCSKGGDRFAIQISNKYGIPRLIFPPDYKKFSRWDAPLERNTDVARISDVIIACVMHPENGLIEVLKRKKGGTEDTLKKYVNFKKDSTKRMVYLV